jgi:hypothetical protein
VILDSSASLVKKSEYIKRNQPVVNFRFQEMSIEQKRTEIERIDPNLKLRAKLLDLVPNFLEIRAKMRVGTAVGFGFLPLANQGPTAAALPPVFKRGGELYYTIPFLFEMENIKLTDKEAENLLVFPSMRKGHSRIVSIYQWGNKTVDPMLLRAGVKVFEGLIAHELAHIHLMKKPPIPLVKRFLRLRGEDMKRADESSNPDMEFDYTDEAVADVVAGLFGYKDQIVAKINYMMRSLEKRKGNRKPIDSLTKPTGELIKELKVRLKEVRRYCP